MEYGQIFHVMHIGKYYCKNMKYRINTKYSTLPRGISVYIAPKVGCNICRHFTRKGFEYLVYYIGYSLPRELLYP